jgi:hypothetical protein
MISADIIAPLHLDDPEQVVGFDNLRDPVRRRDGDEPGTRPALQATAPRTRRRRASVGSSAEARRCAVLGARYAALVASSEQHVPPVEPADDAAVRDPLAVPEAVIDARRRPMSERLELALNWNTVASELRAGLAAVKRRTPPNQ